MTPTEQLERFGISAETHRGGTVLIRVDRPIINLTAAQAQSFAWHLARAYMHAGMLEPGGRPKAVR